MKWDRALFVKGGKKIAVKTAVDEKATVVVVSFQNIYDDHIKEFVFM